MDINTGIVERVSDGTLLRIRANRPELLKQKGVQCENPAANPEDRIYAKLFPPEKRIFLPNEYDLAVQEVLGRGRTPNLFVFGGNGFSELSPERLKAWGLNKGDYEAACTNLFILLLQLSADDFPGINRGVGHGASGIGVDKALIAAANHVGVPQLGHTCPGYLFYVDPDDGIPLVCMENKEEYASAFVRSIDLLVGCNGGEQSLKQDIIWVLRHQRHYLGVDVVGAISSGGSLQPVSDGKIYDAVRALQHYVHIVGAKQSIQTSGKFEEAIEEARLIMRQVARQHKDIIHQVKYGNLSKQMRAS
jgi:hypothetical protein